MQKLTFRALTLEQSELILFPSGSHKSTFIDRVCQSSFNPWCNCFVILSLLVELVLKSMYKLNSIPISTIQNTTPGWNTVNRSFLLWASWCWKCTPWKVSQRASAAWDLRLYRYFSRLGQPSSQILAHHKSRLVPVIVMIYWYSEICI